MEIIIMVFYKVENDLILDWLEKNLNVNLFIFIIFVVINNYKD